MRGPDVPVEQSFALSGDIEKEPNNIIAVVVTDEDDSPAGVLEKWSAGAWIYCEAGDLVSLN